MKIEDVQSWPIPDCLKSVRQFLGFVGYYRRFISNFADMAEPLVSLTRKDIPFVWRPACLTPFINLRDALVRAPILSFPPWAEVKSLCTELRFLWQHRNNLSADTNGVIWRKRSSNSQQLQLLIPKAGRQELFLAYHASLFGGHLGRTRN